MAFKKLVYLLTLSSLFYLSLSSQSHPRRHRRYHNDNLLTVDSFAPAQTPLSLSAAAVYSPSPAPTPFYHQETEGGAWAMLQETIGVSAMHMQLLYDNKLVIFDRTDFGLSNLSLPLGRCRYNDDAVKIDCSAHSIVYDVASNTFRPLMVQTDFWCSSGAVLPDGTLLQTGGYRAGARRIRSFSPCDDESCDWIEHEENLTVQRWYATNQILPDGRVIIVGGRRAFSYEFFPKVPENGSSSVFKLSFLQETSDSKEENNLYPFLHVLPDGNLFIFANQRSILLDYVSNRIIREFPAIPDAKRSYPATGSSVLLPLKLIAGELLPEAEVMVCGGSYGGAYLKARTGNCVTPGE